MFHVDAVLFLERFEVESSTGLSHQSYLILHVPLQDLLLIQGIYVLLLRLVSPIQLFHLLLHSLLYLLVHESLVHHPSLHGPIDPHVLLDLIWHVLGEEPLLHLTAL